MVNIVTNMKNVSEEMVIKHKKMLSLNIIHGKVLILATYERFPYSKN